MNEYVKVELSDELKSNFRSWEYDCDTERMTIKLATILKQRHPAATYELCYEFAKDWTGYDDGCE